MRPVLLLLLALLLLPLTAAAGPKNIVDNPSFTKKGDDPVPDWKIRSIARKTDFRVQGGKLTAERSPGPVLSADACYQTLFPPQGTRALRVSVRAACERVMDARITLRFQDRNGSAMGRTTLFRFRGTHSSRHLEKDVFLPDGTRNVQISIDLRKEGKLVLDEVNVFALDPDEVRPQARLVMVTGVVAVTTAGSASVPEAEISFPVPPVTATQCPVAIGLRSEPPGRIRKARLEREDSRATLVLTVGTVLPEAEILLFFTARVVVTEREDYRKLTDPVPFVPSRHLNRRMLPWVALPAGHGLEDDARSLLEESPDFLALAKSITTRCSRLPDPQGATLAAKLFRACDVPARQLALIPIGDASAFARGVDAFHRDLGWLRFGVGKKDPHPLPAARDALLAAAPPDDENPPEAPQASPGVKVTPGILEGLEGGGTYLARETASLVLPPGAAPDLIAGLAKPWDRTTREIDPTAGCQTPRKKVVLSGKAGKLKKHLKQILGEEE